MMKTRLKLVLLVVLSLLVLSFLSLSTSAQQTTQYVTAFTGEIDLGSDFRLMGMFVRLPVSLLAPEKLNPNRNATWSFQLSPATISLEIYVPSPINRMCATFGVEIDDTSQIDLEPGISVALDFSPSVKLDVRGPATLNRLTFAWEHLLETQNFETAVYQNASDRDQITVNANFYLNTNFSVYVKRGNFTADLLSIPITQLKLQPTISSSVEVSRPLTVLDQIINIMRNPVFPITLGLALISLLAFVVVDAKRGKKIKEERKALDQAKELPEPREVAEPQKPVAEPKAAIYCMHCGEILPTSATYCRKCGQKVE